MYDDIFAKSFSRYHGKRFGCFALLFSLLISLTIFSILHSFTVVDDDITYHSAQTLETSNVELQPPQKDINNTPMNPHSSKDAAQTTNVTVAEPETELPQEKKPQSMSQPKREVEVPLCRVLKAKADYCEIEGDIRVDLNSSTVFLIRSGSTSTSWTMQPYPRKGIAFVKKWTVTVAPPPDDGVDKIPKCTQNHPHPAVLFSIGGYIGNFFHDFADILFPLFTTSLHFQRDVHFLAAEYKPWWLSKYRPLLHQLTRHDILNADHETPDIHCFSKLTAGVRFHRELVEDPTSGVSMSQFRQLLRQTYSLDRKTAGGTKPRLMIVSRNRTRILMNEGEVAAVARKLGYEVVSAEARVSTNLTMFAQLVNSFDVMMGVHGAGLGNMIFLPEKAVVIQVVPLGRIENFAKLYYGDPPAGMNISYLEYRIELKESSLRQSYPLNHPVIKDPMSVHAHGFSGIKKVYLNNQNVTIDVARFTPTLAMALKLLPS